MMKSSPGHDAGRDRPQAIDTDRVSGYLADVFHVWTYAVIVGLVAYGSALSSPAIGVDVDVELARPGHTYFFALGRWLINLVRLALPLTDGSLYFVRLFSVVVLSFSAALFSVLIPASNAVRVVFAVLAVSFPVNAYILQFANQCDAVSIGVLCATLSSVMFYLWLREAGWAWAFLALPFAVLAIGPYQSMVFLLLAQYVAVIFILHAYSDKPFDTKRCLRSLLYAAIIAVVSFEASGLIGDLLCKIYNVKQSAYLSGYSHIKNFGASLDNLWRHIFRFYAGYLYYGTVTATVAFLCFVLEAASLLRAKADRSGTIVSIFLLAALLLSPFGYLLFLNGFPARAMMCLPFVTGFLCVLPVLRLKGLPVRVAFLAVGLVVLTNIFFNARLFEEDYRSYVADNVLLNNMAQRVCAEGVAGADGMYVVALLGTVNHEPGRYFSTHEAFGYSQLRDGVDPTRLLEKLKLDGQGYFVNASPRQYERAREAARAMPSWPAAGSVKAVDDFVVVKLSGGD